MGNIILFLFDISLCLIMIGINMALICVILFGIFFVIEFTKKTVKKHKEEEK